MRMRPATRPGLRREAAETLADGGRQAHVMSVAHEEIARRVAEEFPQRALVADGRQVQEFRIEDQPRLRLVEAHRRAEEQAVVGAGRRRAAAEIDPADR